MKKNQIKELKERIFAGKEEKITFLDHVFDLIRETSCLPDIIGRTYHVKNPKTGKILYIIEQKPMDIKQLDILGKLLVKAMNRDTKKMNAMMGGGKK